MEHAIELAFRSLGNLILLTLRLAIWLLDDLWFDGIGWWFGWPVCRVVTLNNFPQEKFNQQDDASTMTGGIVSVVGLVFLFSAAIVLTKLLDA